MGTPWNTLQLGGAVRLISPGMRLEAAQGRWRIDGRADVELLGVSSRMTTLNTLGNYRMSVSGAQGGTPRLQLSTQDGALKLSGEGSLGPSGLSFRGEARAEAADEPALAGSAAKALLPEKPVAELYTVLGRARQGKTERYRALMQHLAQSDDLFEHARGETGMVMEVFTLPSFNLVFKVIRDRFAPPKTVRREEVREKYELVFRHDRAGRLVDAQEFRRLSFDVRRFNDKLLAALLEGCSLNCRIEGDQLLIEHIYIERRLTPLNIYLREASAEDAASAVIDYGQAIRDLASSNIFAGDLLPKNFGVTRRGRVIFYDYDEVCQITDCRFRDFPHGDDVDEMRAGAWFYVAPNDVFPEQFIQCIGLSPELRQLFRRLHGELLTANWWTAIRLRLSRGETIDVLPYSLTSRVTRLPGAGHYASAVHKPIESGISGLATQGQ